MHLLEKMHPTSPSPFPSSPSQQPLHLLKNGLYTNAKMEIILHARATGWELCKGVKPLLLSRQGIVVYM